MTKQQHDVNKAYSLQTPEDSKALYADWAETYDNNFAKAADYVFPQRAAEVFHELGGAGPVLDVGAGTGLVAQALTARSDVIVDGFDISPEMLAVAAKKAVYRELIEGDLTQTLPFDTGAYNAVISAGTFTHGHVGPEALDELLRIASAGALFVITIKAAHFEDRGFAEKFKSFGPAIDAFDLREVAIYGKDADEAHAGDAGLIASFRRV